MVADVRVGMCVVGIERGAIAEANENPSTEVPISAPTTAVLVKASPPHWGDAVSRKDV